MRANAITDLRGYFFPVFTHPCRCYGLGFFFVCACCARALRTVSFGLIFSLAFWGLKRTYSSPMIEETPVFLALVSLDQYSLCSCQWCYGPVYYYQGGRSLCAFAARPTTPRAGGGSGKLEAGTSPTPLIIVAWTVAAFHGRYLSRSATLFPYFSSA